MLAFSKQLAYNLAVMEIGTFEAKNRFSELVHHVMDTGEEVLVTLRGKKAVKIVPVEAKIKKNTAAILDELVQYAKKHNIRSDGVPIKQMIEDGRKY
jgi:prevent-host-death family protein